MTFGLCTCARPRPHPLLTIEHALRPARVSRARALTTCSISCVLTITHAPRREARVYTRGRPVQHGAVGFPDHTGPRHQERQRCRPAAAIALAALTAAITAALTAALTAFPASSTHTSGALSVLTSAARRPHRRATASAHPAATTWLLELECGHARASRVHPPCPSCWPHPRSPREL